MNMDNELISKSIPAAMLLILGIMEAMGGLYLKDKKN
jgi:hypothetical protein